MERLRRPLTMLFSAVFAVAIAVQHAGAGAMSLEMALSSSTQMGMDCAGCDDNTSLPAPDCKSPCASPLLAGDAAAQLVVSAVRQQFVPADAGPLHGKTGPPDPFPPKH